MVLAAERMELQGRIPLVRGMHVPDALDTVGNEPALGHSSKDTCCLAAGSNLPGQPGNAWPLTSACCAWANAWWSATIFLSIRRWGPPRRLVTNAWVCTAMMKRNLWNGLSGGCRMPRLSWTVTKKLNVIVVCCQPPGSE